MAGVKAPPATDVTAVPALDELREVSRSVKRVESVEKVTGSAEYIHHLRLPRMLYGKIVGASSPSTHPRHSPSRACTASSAAPTC